MTIYSSDGQLIGQREASGDPFDIFPKKRTSWPGILCFVIALWGLVALFELPDVIRTWPAYLWVQTPCVILSAKPVHYFEFPNNTAESMDFYGAALTYSYKFGGGKYEGDRYSLSCSFDKIQGSEGSAQRKYPVGRELTCYVNPRKPSEAVIDRSFTATGIVVMAFIPPVLFVVGVLAPIAIVRRVRAERRMAGRPE